MTNTVVGPDGQHYQFPDGTSDQEILKFLHSGAAPSQPTESTPLHKLGVALSSLPKGFLEGINAMTAPMQSIAFSTPNGPLMSPEQNSQKIESTLAQPVPGNTTEKYINAVGEGIGSVPAGGPLGPETSVGRAALTGGLSGAGSQAAGDLTNQNPIAKLVGALLGQSPVMASKLLLQPNNARAVAQKALETVPDKEFEFSQAQGNQATAQAQGIPQTTAQAFENAPGLQNLQNALTASGKAPKTSSVLQTQPNIALNKAKDAVNALPGAQEDSLAVANQTNQAASDYVKSLYSKASGEYTAALGGGKPQLTDRQVSGFAGWLKSFSKANPNSKAGDLADSVLDSIQNPAAQAPKPTGGPQLLNASGQPLAVAAAQQAPKFINDGLALKQAIYDAINTQGRGALRAPRSINASDMPAIAAIRNQANAMFSAASPEISQANSAFEKVVTDEINPAKENYVGQVAGRAGAQDGLPAPQKVYSILDNGTTPGVKVSPILTLARQLNSQDPTAFATAVKSNLADKWGKSVVTQTGQTDPAGISTFYNSVYGNAAQKQGLKEQLVGVAEGQGMSSNALYPGFLRIMDTLGRIGKIRPDSVSGTNEAELGQMAGSNQVSNLLRIFSPVAQAKNVAGIYSSNVAKQFDDIFTSPNGVQLLKKLATNDPMGKVGQQALISYLAAQGGQQQQQNPSTITQP